MAVAASGAVSFSDLRTEFSGAGAISFSNFYRGGTLIKGNATNNTATNLAASVPASGTINFTNFRGAARGWRKTYSSGAENQSASAIFGTDYGVDYPKEIVINSGVTLGATSTSDEALEISTGGVGSITITNNGTIIGKGGASDAVGGDAFEAFVACIFVNNGFVYGGGGGGANGGAGGGGSYSSSSTQFIGNTQGRSYYQNDNQCASGNGYGTDSFRYAYECGQMGTLTCVCKFGGGAYGSGYSWGNYGVNCNCYRNVSSTTNTNGGSGGSGGQGAGYNQNVQSGSNGSNGGTNAGAGGAGGTGGGFGASGSNGNSGNNGNRTSGSGGGSGKAAGKHIRGLSFVTFTNNGTVAGGTA